MIILDTNILSEVMRPRPSDMVLSWLGSSNADLMMTSITVQEIERGLLLIPAGERQRKLTEMWTALLRDFETKVVPFDSSCARHAARNLVGARQRGRTMSVEDAQIAGCCLARGAALATRNVKDFDFIDGVEIINPFDGSVALP